MAELLIELFSEEIPARMQAKAIADFEKMMLTGLQEAGLHHGDAAGYVTPRRLTLRLDDVAGQTPHISEERRGPRVGAPQKALEGFLRGAGVTQDQLEVREEKKGSFYFAKIEKPGRAATDVIAEVLRQVIRNFPWPKSQHWGSGDLRWVRPLQRILCLFDGAVVPFEIDGIQADNKTEAHRFMAPGELVVSGFEDYLAELDVGHVVLDAAKRRDMIADGCQNLAAAEGLDWVEDSGLLAEVAGLVEYPVPMLGSFDAAFLGVPEEVLILTMKKDQKYFVLRDPSTGKLANKFIFVANIKPTDGGAAVRGGNERVLRARLADARFFWEQDQKQPLETLLPKLDDIVFHEKLGTVGDRVRRMEIIARDLAASINGGDADTSARAAKLAKADLVSQMVYEFPELQGIVGQYLAAAGGEDAEVAAACQAHYSPLGPDDACPTAPVSIAVALAEKVDTLVGLYGVGERPTGSKDPYALRRAALGVIRLITENGLRMSLEKLLVSAAWTNLTNFDFNPEVVAASLGTADVHKGAEHHFRESFLDDLLAFFVDRLKVQQKAKGVRHDVIDAVFAKGDLDLVRALKRVDAVQTLLATDDGQNLLAAYKRARNIVAAEVKKGNRPADQIVENLFAVDAEKTLYAALNAAVGQLDAALAGEDYGAAAQVLAGLRASIDQFFEDVLVVSKDAAVTANRLALVSLFGAAADEIADFSKIEG